MGNLIPVVFSLPWGAYGAAMAIRTQKYFGPGLLMLVGSVVLMWILVNFVGAYENPRLKRELARRLAAEKTPLDGGAVFVGFARPSHVGWLDPHEDIGFLSLGPASAVFHGEAIDLEIPKDEIDRVRHRFNAHTFAGLGRWVSIEGKTAGVPFRLLVEPRERRTLLGNFIYSTDLRKRVEGWLKEKRPRPEPGP